MLNPIVKIGEGQDLGEAIQKLIEDNFARLNKCYLAKVESVDDSKVDVSFLVGETRLIIPSLLVGLPSAGIKIASILKAGDVGVCLTSDYDISSYAQSGSGGKPLTSRTHSIIDSIFLPLSLFDSDLSQNLISSEAGIEIRAGEVLKLVASKFTLKNENESLKEILKEFTKILKKFKTAPVANGSPAVIDPSLVLEISALENRIEGFLDE